MEINPLVRSQLGVMAASHRVPRDTQTRDSVTSHLGLAQCSHVILCQQRLLAINVQFQGSHLTFVTDFLFFFCVSSSEQHGGKKKSGGEVPIRDVEGQEKRRWKVPLPWQPTITQADLEQLLWSSVRNWVFFFFFSSLLFFCFSQAEKLWASSQEVQRDTGRRRRTNHGAPFTVRQIAEHILSFLLQGFKKEK